MSAARALLEAARDHGADVILCHWLLPAGPSAALAARALHAPLVVVAHGSDVNTYAESSLLHLGASRVVIHRASAIVAASTALGEAISERLTGTPRPVDVIPMGVDERFFGAPARRVERRAAREQLGIRPDARLLLFVGDLTESKGVPELLAAHRTLLERGLDCDLALVGAHGPGSERALTDGVRSSSSSAAPLRVLAPGAVPQRDLVAWYRAADLFVLPSHAEGSPVSLMEALSCGLPAVASNVGGIPELIAWGRNGWLVPPREPRILADTLAGLLGDPPLSSMLGVRSKSSRPISRRARAPRSSSPCCSERSANLPAHESVTARPAAKEPSTRSRSPLMAVDAARYYDQYWAERDGRRTEARSRERARAAVELFRGEGVASGRLLDAGCGPGYSLDEFRAAGFDAIGVDASASAVESARARGHDARTVDLEAGSSLAAAGLAAPFAGIAALEVLEHLVDPLRVLTTLAATACARRPAGRLAPQRSGPACAAPRARRADCRSAGTTTLTSGTSTAGARGA
jgi:glycosyltransferase involved in cell wall biosynthesis